MFALRFVVVVVALAMSLTAAQDAVEMPSTLLESVVADDVLGIRAALRDGASIDTTNVNGWSAAMFAVTSGHIRSLHTLIDAGIDLNQANADHKTPLMFAAGQGDKEIVELLLNNNADPSHEWDGVSAYDLAMDAGRPLGECPVSASLFLSLPSSVSPNLSLRTHTMHTNAPCLPPSPSLSGAPYRRGLRATRHLQVGVS